MAADFGIAGILYRSIVCTLQPGADAPSSAAVAERAFRNPHVDGGTAFAKLAKCIVFVRKDLPVIDTTATFWGRIPRPVSDGN